MTRHLLLSAALIASVTAMASFAAPASAQDPAAVGSHRDSAFVGNTGGGLRGNGAAAGSFGNQTLADDDTQAAREASIREVEAMLQSVRSQLSGTSDTSLTANNNRNRHENSSDRDAARYRSEAEALIRRNWEQLGPLTRDLYTSNYDRTDPNDPNQRYQPRHGNEGDPEAKMLGGAQDAAGAMQNLEDLLLPMLQDLKRGLDTGLQQRSR
jgi:hypothetical protein